MNRSKERYKEDTNNCYGNIGVDDVDDEEDDDNDDKLTKAHWKELSLQTIKEGSQCYYPAQFASSEYWL